MLYKVTDSRGCTRGGTQWGPGITHTATGDPSQDLNSDGWIHAYEHPVLALIFRSLHADHGTDKLLWEAQGIIERRFGHVKCACRTLTTIRQALFPAVPLQALADIAVSASEAARRDTCIASAWAERSAWAAQQTIRYASLMDEPQVLLHTARAAECATFSVPGYHLDLIRIIDRVACLR